MAKLIVRAVALFLMLVVAPALAQQSKPVSQMPSATLPLSGSELFYLIQNGQSSKSTLSQINQSPYAATGATTALTPAKRASFTPTPFDYGAYADATIASVTATMTVGQTTVFTTTPTFVPCDAGCGPVAPKVIGVTGAGLTNTFGSISSVPLSVQGSYTFPPSITASQGSYVSLTGIWQATAVSISSGGGGAGCTPGTHTYSLAAAGGTPATVSVTISGGGAATGVSIVTGGAFELKSLLKAVPLSASFPAGNPSLAASACTTSPTFDLTATMSSVYVSSAGLNVPTVGTTVSIVGGTGSLASVAGAPVITPAINTLAGTITTYLSPTSVIISTPALTQLSNTATQIVYGHDDTTAFTSCMATLNCVVPPGTYMIGDVAPANGGSLIGPDATTYAGVVAGNPNASQTLSPVGANIIVAPTAKHAFKMYNTYSVYIKGLFIDCVDQQRDGISAGALRATYELNTINRCYYGVGSSEAGAYDVYTHTSNLLNNQISNNAHGLSNFIDSRIRGGAVSSNQIGIYFGNGGYSTVTDVRIEWNFIGLEDFQANDIQVTGGLFDRNYSCGLLASQSTGLSVKNAMFNRNGKANDFVFNKNAHWCLSSTTDTSIESAMVNAADDGSTVTPYNTLSPLYVGSYNTSTATPVNTQITGMLDGGYTYQFSQAQPNNATYGFDAYGAGMPDASSTLALGALTLDGLFSIYGPSAVCSSVGVASCIGPGGSSIYGSMRYASHEDFGATPASVGGNQIIVQSSNNTSSAFYGCVKTRGTTKGAGPGTTVAAGDGLCEVNANADDGTSFVSAWSEDVSVDDVVSTGIVPTNWQIWVGNTSGTHTLAVLADSRSNVYFRNGNVGIGAYGYTPPATYTNAPPHPISISKTTDSILIQGVYTGSSGGGFEEKVMNGFGAGCIYCFWFDDTTGLGNPASNVVSVFTNATETWRMDASFHESTGSTAKPAVSACGTGSPATDTNATDADGTITVGGGSVTSCTMTFRAAYSTFAHCNVTARTGQTFSYDPSGLSTLVLTGTALAGKFDYICRGR